MKVCVALDLSYTDIQTLIKKAYSLGWNRDRPRTNWTPKEEKEVVRWLVEYHIKDLTT
jgi:hypothetical protein